MKVLIVGNGPKEQALADKISQSTGLEKLFRWPSAGKGLRPNESFNLPDSASITDVARRAERMGVGLVVLASEDAVTSGLGNVLETFRIPCFGPTRVAAHFQWDPTCAQRFLNSRDIRIARQNVAYSGEECLAMSERYLEIAGSVELRAIVPDHVKIKRVCANRADVERFVGEINALFGNTSMRPTYAFIERIEGPVCSYTAFVGPRSVVPIGFVGSSLAADIRVRAAAAPLSAYAPVEGLPSYAEALVTDALVRPLIEELRQSSMPYCGWINIETAWRDKIPVVTDISCVLDNLTMGVLTAADGRDWLEILKYVVGISSVMEAKSLVPDLKPAVAVSWLSQDRRHDGEVSVAEAGPTLKLAWDSCCRKAERMRYSNVRLGANAGAM